MILKQIQKKPLGHRKKFLVIVLVIVGAALIPIWFIGFKIALNREKSNPPSGTNKSLEELKEIGAELGIAAEEMNKMLKELNGGNDEGEQADGSLPPPEPRFNASSTLPMAY